MVSGSPKTIAAIGNFDGVHVGHQALIQETAEFAASHGSTPAAVVFDPHPRRFFQPDAPPFLISDPDARDALLIRAGAAKVIRLRFDAALAAMSPKTFVVEVLQERLRLSGALTGSDFRFGAGRAGDVEMLARLCADARLVFRAIEPAAAAGEAGKIGSSGVREAIAVGDMARARELLGRSWSVRGDVCEGRRLGRTIGFPTANLTLGDLIEPAYGVYAVLISMDGEPGRAMPGVANFGRRPTVGAATPLLEVHVFEFDGDLYGRRLDVAFVDYIRAERKFESIDALKAQIAVDAESARAVLSDR